MSDYTDAERRDEMLDRLGRESHALQQQFKDLDFDQIGRTFVEWVMVSAHQSYEGYDFEHEIGLVAVMNDLKLMFEYSHGLPLGCRYGIGFWWDDNGRKVED